MPDPPGQCWVPLCAFCSYADQYFYINKRSAIFSLKSPNSTHTLSLQGRSALPFQFIMDLKTWPFSPPGPCNGLYSRSHSAPPPSQHLGPRLIQDGCSLNKADSRWLLIEYGPKVGFSRLWREGQRHICSPPASHTTYSKKASNIDWIPPLQKIFNLYTYLLFTVK